jgi:hypothetical protein
MSLPLHALLTHWRQPEAGPSWQVCCAAFEVHMDTPAVQLSMHPGHALLLHAAPAMHPAGALQSAQPVSWIKQTSTLAPEQRLTPTWHWSAQ